MKFIKLISIIALGAVMAGCCHYCRVYQRKYGSPLKHTPWTLVSIDGQQVANSYVMVLSASDRLSVTGPSAIGGAYKAVDDGRIAFPDVAITGDGAPDEEVRLLARRLSATDSYKHDGPFLIFSSNGEAHLMFEAKH